MGDTVVLYDDDCGFCRTILGALLLADRRRRLRPLPLQAAAAEALLPGESEEERLAAVHVVTPSGRVLRGGAALAAVLRALPGGRPAGALLEQAPGLSERGYRLVADNRSRLSRLVPRRARDRADALIARRSA